MARFIFCLTFLLLGFRVSHAAPETSPLRLRLELIREPKPHPGTLPVRFWIENTSRETVSVTRPTYPHGGHWGWKFQINGPGGDYAYISIPMVYAPLNNTDFVPLDAGEMRGQIMDLAGAVCFIPAQGNKPTRSIEILETPGRYTVTAGYFMPAEPLKQTGVDMKDVFTGSLESNTVMFEVGRNGKVEIKGR